MKRSMRILVASVLVALAPVAAAQTAGTSPLDAQATVLDQTAANRGQALVAGKIASNFTGLAGSEENAVALVNALRTGESATLTYAAPEGGTGTGTGTGTEAPAPVEVTIDPATGKMGWGNVKIALALAQDSLARAGITNPTAEQLQAALNGGDVTITNADGTTSTVTLKGVLQMRADGMGWGEIAKANGTRVGPVVSQLKMANRKVAALPPSDGTPTATAAPAKSKAVTTATGGQARGKGVTTATGETVAGRGKGVTTGAGGSASGRGKGVTTAAGGSSGARSSGITTATGSGAVGGGHGSRGITTAAGAGHAGASRGLVTAEGSLSAPRGNAYGRGVVTAGGGAATGVTAATGGRGHGAGLVTGGGGSASGLTTANGNAGGHGKGPGNGKGKGPGG